MRTLFRLPFSTILVVLSAGVFNQSVADDLPERAVLRFPTPFHLTQSWVYNDAPPRFEPLPVVFLTGEAVDPVHGAQVVVAHESLLTNDGLVQLLTTGITADDERLLFQVSAPQYHRTFTRCDVDGDGVDEVLLTGRGGAGGNSFMQIFAIDESSVRVLYDGGSKFGMIMIDSDDDGAMEIWNAGIDFEVDEERNLLVPRDYEVLTLRDGEYSGTTTISRGEAEGVLTEHHDRLSADVGVVRVYD